MSRMMVENRSMKFNGRLLNIARLPIATQPPTETHPNPTIATLIVIFFF
jgi:hypothetical protein